MKTTLSIALVLSILNPCVYGQEKDNDILNKTKGKFDQGATQKKTDPKKQEQKKQAPDIPKNEKTAAPVKIAPPVQGSILTVMYDYLGSYYQIPGVVMKSGDEVLVKTDRHSFLRIVNGKISEIEGNQERALDGAKLFKYMSQDAAPREKEREAHNTWHLLNAEENNAKEIWLYTSLHDKKMEKISLSDAKGYGRALELAQETNKPGYAGYMAEKLIPLLPSDKDDLCDDHASQVKNALAAMGFKPSDHNLAGSHKEPTQTWEHNSQSTWQEEQKNFFVYDLNQKKMIPNDDAAAAGLASKAQELAAASGQLHDKLGERVGLAGNMDMNEIQAGRKDVQDRIKGLLFSSDCGGKLK